MPKDGLQTIYENTAFYGSSTAEANDPAVCCVGSKQSRWLCGDHNRPESEECQVYMADRCSKGEWDSFCDVYSKDDSSALTTSKDVDGDVSLRSKFLRNTLANKYCKLSTKGNRNCRPTPSLFDLALIDGPIITKYGGECVAECSEFTVEKLEDDVVLEECLRGNLCNDVIDNMIKYASDSGMDLDGTKLGTRAMIAADKMSDGEGWSSVTAPLSIYNENKSGWWPSTLSEGWSSVTAPLSIYNENKTGWWPSTLSEGWSSSATTPISTTKMTLEEQLREENKKFRKKVLYVMLIVFTCIGFGMWLIKRTE